MPDAVLVKRIGRKFCCLKPLMNERVRRLWAATEAQDLGRGGDTIVSHALRMSRATISAGKKELRLSAKKQAAAAKRVRRPGAGRPGLTDKHPRLPAKLEGLIEPRRRGARRSPLCWSCMSTQQLAERLKRYGDPCARSVASLLHGLGYRLDGYRKPRKRAADRQRHAQFKHLNQQVRRFLKQGQPVVHVVLKRKELAGIPGRESRYRHPRQDAGDTQLYERLKKTCMTGIRRRAGDILSNYGWVNVGIDQTTAQFVANSVRHWWRKSGSSRFRKARELLVVVDGNLTGKRAHFWKVFLQRLSDELGLRLVVCRLPPGTSRWTRIVEQVANLNTQRRPRCPWVSHLAIVNQIGSATKNSAPIIKAVLDRTRYGSKIKPTDEENA
jgi:hypothetical protein